MLEGSNIDGGSPTRPCWCDFSLRWAPLCLGPFSTAPHGTRRARGERARTYGECPDRAGDYDSTSRSQKLADTVLESQDSELSNDALADIAGGYLDACIERERYRTAYPRTIGDGEVRSALGSEVNGNGEGGRVFNRGAGGVAAGRGVWYRMRRVGFGGMAWVVGSGEHAGGGRCTIVRLGAMCTCERHE